MQAPCTVTDADPVPGRFCRRILLSSAISSADHVCVREEACEVLIAKSFNQQTAYDGSKGYCNNPQAIKLSDEQVNAYLAK